MNETEIQEIVGSLGQQIAAQAIDLAVARATIAKLERELAATRSDLATGAE